MADVLTPSDGRMPEGLGAGIIPAAITAVIKGPTVLCGTGRSFYEAIVIAGQFKFLVSLLAIPVGRY